MKRITIVTIRIQYTGQPIKADITPINCLDGLSYVVVEDDLFAKVNKVGRLREQKDLDM